MKPIKNWCRCQNQQQEDLKKLLKLYTVSEKSQKKDLLCQKDMKDFFKIFNKITRDENLTLEF